MLNIPDLEKRWLHYKIKSFLPYVVTLSFICIVIGAYSFFNIINNKKIVEINSTIITPLPIKEKKQIVVQKSLHTKPTKLTKASLKNTKEDNNTPKLSPSMNFISTIQQQKVAVIQRIKQQKVTSPKQIIKPKQEVSTITITKQDTSKDIQNILHRFKEDKNPALSLFLAKKYYELGNYEKASNYALITNQLNDEIEDSWLIFAKSLVKRGEKERAIQLLQKYINNSHSTNAAILLNDIKSGEFQ